MKLRSLTEAVDTETPTGRLMFDVLGTIAEYSLDLNRERTLEELKAAAVRGRKGWRQHQCRAGDHCPTVVAFLVQSCGFSTRTYA